MREWEDSNPDKENWDAASRLLALETQGMKVVNYDQVRALGPERMLSTENLIGHGGAMDTVDSAFKEVGALQQLVLRRLQEILDQRDMKIIYAHGVPQMAKGDVGARDPRLP